MIFLKSAALENFKVSQNNNVVSYTYPSKYIVLFNSMKPFSSIFHNFIKSYLLFFFLHFFVEKKHTKKIFNTRYTICKFLSGISQEIKKKKSNSIHKRALASSRPNLTTDIAEFKKWWNFSFLLVSILLEY